MHRTAARMADGRELFYFDRMPRNEDAPIDQREIDPVASHGTIRYDALFDEWVSIAGHRQTRTFLPSASACPLCPSSPDNLSEIPADDYEVVVFENRFPSFASPIGEFSFPATGFGAIGESAGRCEVVCFSPDHNSSFAQLTPERARLVIDAWADRTQALLNLDCVQFVFPFENRGEEIGVTLHHPHGQIYAYPFIPPRERVLLEASQRYSVRTGRHMITDLVESEVSDDKRIVVSSEFFIAFVPFAARWPFQVQIHPRRLVADFTELTDAERDDLARIYLDVLARLDGVFGVAMPYIAAWHQAPKGELRQFGRLHLDLFSSRRAPDKLKFPAGSEAAMGAFINDVTPEYAADLLRGVPA